MQAEESHRGRGGYGQPPWRGWGSVFDRRVDTARGQRLRYHEGRTLC